MRRLPLLLRPRQALPYLAWVAGTAGLLAFYAPLFPKHVVVAVPPLVVVAGAGIGLIWQRLRQLLDRISPMAEDAVIAIQEGDLALA